MDSFSAHQQSGADLGLEPERTALLIVDMLNDFCEPGGAMVLPDADVLYEPQNRLIGAIREAGGQVVFVNDAHRPGMRRDREFLKRDAHCIQGTAGAAVVSALSQTPQDLTVTKRRYSGFFQTDLDLTLKDMQIDTLIVAGVVTNICVRSTVHDAFFLGYRVAVPEDCVAATGEREQASSLYDIATHFGWVTRADDVVAALTEGVKIRNAEQYLTG
ncbi:MAG: cysteine hydrolase family protein [Burkholderiaceae bacterium]